MWVPGKTSVETRECIFPRFQVFSYFGKSRTANIDSDFFIWSYIFWSSSLTKNTVRWRYPNTSKLLLIRYPLDKGSQLNVLKTFRRLYLYTFHAVLNKRPAQRKRKRHKDSRSVFWTVISFAKKPHHRHLTGPKIRLWNMWIYSKLMLSHHNDGRVFSVNFKKGVSFKLEI